MTRFWITLEQGVELVFKALEESRGGETFISKIPSFRITDLAKAMLEDADLKEVGVREGEKLHEVMITKDDSRTTFEYEEYYIIYPYFKWWNSDKQFDNGGKRVEKGFEYSSRDNTEWLNIKALRQELYKLGLYDAYKINGITEAAAASDE